VKHGQVVKHGQEQDHGQHEWIRQEMDGQDKNRLMDRNLDWTDVSYQKTIFFN
ncbi:hypothetical protein B0O80DRAFT_457176, partial [Mortierella sp. GBAus27b]